MLLQKAGETMPQCLRRLKEPVRRRIQRLSETRNIPTADSPAKVYATLAEALGRFRLMPPQPAGNLFAADFIARHSLKRAPLEGGTGDGWAGRFDPNMWIKLDITDMGLGGRRREDLEVPLVHFYGAQSRLMEHRLETARTLFPPGCLEIEIPDAGHHVMVDQPLALVAGLRTLLAAWPPAA